MVDTWATVGSCAQIGKNVHLSGGVGIGGVLEPMQAGPTIIEDNCFIGARSEVVEGVSCAKARCCRWASSSAPRPRSSTATPAKIHIGKVPPYSVVVPAPARQAAAQWRARPEPLLRRDRQDASTRRPAPRPASTSCCGIDSGGAFWETLLSAVMIASLWAQAALGAKRLHDLDKPGLFAALLFVPLLNFIVFVGLCLMPGTPGANQYGQTTNRPK
jgi:carbonic anhydrase/acetyltransferase-like protein (isoleucine patch superfamily)